MPISSLPVLAICFLLVQVSSCLELPGRYLDMPLSSALKVSDGNSVGRVLRGLQLVAGSEPEVVLEQLKACAKTSGSCNAHDSIRAANLAQLASDESDCSVVLVSTFLYTYKAYSHTWALNQPQVMLNFLEHYGREKFPKCAPKAVESIKQLQKSESKNWAEARKFFKLVLPSVRGNKNFYEKLKQFKPLESSYNVDKLATISDRKWDDQTAAERIMMKFRRVCNFVSRYYKELNIVNLAESFSPEARYFEKDVKLGQLNEMSRTCQETFGEASTRQGAYDCIEASCEPKHDSIYPNKPRTMKSLVSKVRELRGKSKQ